MSNWLGLVSICIRCISVELTPDWQATMRIKAGVGELARGIGDDQAQVQYSVAGRSRGQVMLCAIRIIQIEEMRSTGFSV
jgi:hypothetical protein